MDSSNQFVLIGNHLFNKTYIKTIIVYDNRIRVIVANIDPTGKDQEYWINMAGSSDNAYDILSQLKGF